MQPQPTPVLICCSVCCLFEVRNVSTQIFPLDKCTFCQFPPLSESHPPRQIRQPVTSHHIPRYSNAITQLANLSDPWPKTKTT